MFSGFFLLFVVVCVGFYNDASVQPGNNKKQVEKCRGELAKALGQWVTPSPRLFILSSILTFQWTYTSNCSPTSQCLAKTITFMEKMWACHLRYSSQILGGEILFSAFVSENLWIYFFSLKNFLIFFFICKRFVEIFNFFF